MTKHAITIRKRLKHLRKNASLVTFMRALKVRREFKKVLAM